MNRFLIAIAMGTTCLVSLAAYAEDDFDVDENAPKKAASPYYANVVSLGVGYQSEDSFRFGRYTGLVDKGAVGFGDFSIRGGDDWNSGGTRYWDIEASNLGLTSRSFSLDYGQQGLWGMKLFYDGIPYYQSNSFKTIYDASGTGALNGTAVPSATPWFNSAALAPNLRTQEIKTQRDIFGGSVKYSPIMDWTLSAGVRHEHKEGDIEQSMIFGTGKNAALQGTVPTGASGNIIAFGQPVNFDTNSYEAKVAYAHGPLQGQLSYLYSSFTDNNTSFNAVDPFSSPVTTGAQNGNSLGPLGTFIRGAYSQPPDNSAHQIKGQLGYNFNSKTRLVGYFGYGLMLQDEGYSADTLNSFLLSKGLTSHPNSLNGKIQNFVGNVTFTTQPLPKFDLKASYNIDDHDNLTDRQRIQSFYADSFQTYANAIGAGAAAGVPNFIYSTNVQTAKLEGGYRVLPNTKLMLGYNYKDVTRNTSEVNHSGEHLVFARANSRLFAETYGTLGWEHSNRSGDTYNINAPWQYLGYAATEDRPIKFFESERVRDDVKGRISLPEWNQTQLDIQARYVNNHYPKDVYGLGNDHAISGGPDFSYSPADGVGAHVYYTYEQIFRGQTGFISAALGNWQEKTTDTLHTVGVKGDWKVTDRFKLGASYDFSYGDVSYAVTDQITAAQAGVLANQAFVIQALPSMNAKLHSFNITGEYQLVENWSLWAGYLFEHFDLNDFALAASQNPTQYGNALLGGDANPSYNVHVVAAGVRIRF